MGHLEFLGPPGAGKTTLHRSLITDPVWYGGVTADAISRYHLKQARWRYRLAYQLLPARVQTGVAEEILTYRFRHQAIKRFGAAWPTVIKESARSIANSAVDHELLHQWMNQLFAYYQLGTETTGTDEIFCLDEGFAQKSLAFRWRRAGDHEQASFLRVTPTPQIIIYVSATPEMCLERQTDRGEVVVDKPWVDDDRLTVQRRLHEYCEDIADELRQQSTIIEIDSTLGVTQTINTLRHQLTTYMGDGPTSKITGRVTTD